jgi:hypothetical protein
MDYDILYGIELGIRRFDFMLVQMRIKTNARFPQGFAKRDYGVCSVLIVGDRDESSVIPGWSRESLLPLNKDV